MKTPYGIEDSLVAILKSFVSYIDTTSYVWKEINRIGRVTLPHKCVPHIYVNNAEQHTGRHLRSLINVIFNTKQLNRLVRHQNATAREKRLACAYLTDIASFKDIISNANTYNEVQNRMDELEQLGDEFIEGFHLLAPILERVGNGIYRQWSLWYELVADKSVTYCIKSPNLTANSQH